MEYVTYRETLALRDQYLMSRESIIERIVFRNVLSNVHAYFVIRRTCERFIVKGNAKNLSWCTFISCQCMVLYPLHQRKEFLLIGWNYMIRLYAFIIFVLDFFILRFTLIQ